GTVAARAGTPTRTPIALTAAGAPCRTISGGTAWAVTRCGALSTFSTRRTRIPITTGRTTRTRPTCCAGARPTVVAITLTARRTRVPIATWRTRIATLPVVRATRTITRRRTLTTFTLGTWTARAVVAAISARRA